MAEAGKKEQKIPSDKAGKKDPNYRVLTKEEYDVLVNASLKQSNTSTPLGKPNMSPMARLLNSKPLNFDFPKTPDVPSTPTCTISTQYNFPKLPTFSGADDPKQGEVKYEVWNFEVKCIQNSGQYPEHILLQSVRNSLKGLARSMLVSIGENASLKDILTKLDGFFGNVASGETLMQSFYNDMQKEGESLVVYASRLEDTLSKAIKVGYIDAVAKDAMLRSKFWTGLYNAEIAETTDLQKELQKLTSTMQRLESKIDSNSQSFQQLSNKVNQLERNVKPTKSKFYWVR
ncbi:uncharacterized protein LOC133189208 [Saccostrea echinata]|uniref:uncharacterized protein LOC133189208 n=1 Tax=Saccostrea echinata TaxID=191078 RepID=UPI002A82D353|nr:uncharacterized protein LOC133189208 [Saccostrea echinata]